MSKRPAPAARLPYRLLDVRAKRFLTLREVDPESDGDAPARFPDEDEADQSLEDLDYAAIERGEEPPEVVVVEVDDGEQVVRYLDPV